MWGVHLTEYGFRNKSLKMMTAFQTAVQTLTIL